jgi:3-deoxy-manno-octulosonate cytidylyltransferase (CMP-KDO synthetase)
LKAVIIIPARIASTRLPRKLLLPLGGKPLIAQTCHAAARARRAAAVVVATDSDEIATAVKAEGFEAIMTRADCQSGTDRIADAARHIAADAYINVQGDEPEIDPQSIDALVDAHFACGAFATTLASEMPAGVDPYDPARVKVALGKPLGTSACQALYFSRAPIPFPREGAGAFHLHIGAYAYGLAALRRFVDAPVSRLEAIEKLEQLRILEMGETIAVRIVSPAAPGVDTEADYLAAVRRFGLAG